MTDFADGRRMLIVTADDVGLHPGMTEGAIRAHQDGIVTACSVVANGSAFEAALDPLRDRPQLDVGVHLTLVGEHPLSPPERVVSLVDRNGAFLRDNVLWGVFDMNSLAESETFRHVAV